MCVYSLGECANSLVMNGIFGFAMLCYTKALGLDPGLAGIAMSVSVFWEALSEPVMGHISDNTRSRWGRRHLYMFAGGLLMALCSYLIWAVPDSFRHSQAAIFWYLVCINLLLRTRITMFFIPYMALGFEICTDYQGRSKIQGIRSVFNMAANFLGPAMAWSLFFQNKNGVQATTVADNYVRMGGTFAVATAALVLIVVAATFRWREDTRNTPRNPGQGGFKHFVTDMKQILTDANPRWVFVFIFIVCVGMVLVSSLQMFVYDDFMRFSLQKIGAVSHSSIAHGSTMIGFALGSALSVAMARVFDKKGTVILGGLIGAGSNIMLALLFLTGFVKPQADWLLGGISIPISLILFVIFHAGYWLGCGIMLPISTAMMADISEIHQLQTGENKDGGYSSVFSLAMRMAISFSLIASGYCLKWVGYKVPQGAGEVIQDPAAIWRVGMVTFVIGGAVGLAALMAIWRYPITRHRLEEIRAKHQKTPQLV
jgi:GPH family glycoside/pentoside/hexuronide:cation symporter